MNIKILDSWIKDYLETDATPQKFAELMSLTSVGIEKIEPLDNDWLYDIEVTTNRPDLMSVMGLALEASVVLPQHGVKATYKKPIAKSIRTVKETNVITIKNDPKLVRRIYAVVMDVSLKESPDLIKNRLESSDIRSLNNVIDITNYVMRETGHPTHVFDYDRLTTKELIIRESKKGEKITTLDGKVHTLLGGDIVADNGKGEIIDLLGVMGTANSVITNETKKIMFFLDNVDPHRVRKTSMSLGIRTEAAVLNEKEIDVSVTKEALLHGIELFKSYADAKNISEILEIRYDAPETRTVQLAKEKITRVIGTHIDTEVSKSILQKLGFAVKEDKERLTVEVPTKRTDIQIPEDLIEEIARIYGYHNIPTALPQLENTIITHMADQFYWEQRVKNAMKYWGFVEVYTYAMVPEALFEGELSEAVTIANPLNEDLIYMRKTLVPSLLQVVRENSTKETLKIFEIANVYHKRTKDLPEEKLRFAGVIKKPKLSFFEVKGLMEQVLYDVGITDLVFKPIDKGTAGAEIYLPKNNVISNASERSHGISRSARNDNLLGTIEILDDQTINFEFDFATMVSHATLHKTYTPLPKYPPILEDMSFVISDEVTVGEIVSTIKKQSKLIKDVTLFDKYEDSRTFRIVYQDPEKNLTSETIAPIREKITKTLHDKLKVSLK